MSSFREPLFFLSFCGVKLSSHFFSGKNNLTYFWAGERERRRRRGPCFEADNTLWQKYNVRTPAICQSNDDGGTTIFEERSFFKVTKLLRWRERERKREREREKAHATRAPIILSLMQRSANIVLQERKKVLNSQSGWWWTYRYLFFFLFIKAFTELSVRWFF